MFRPTEEELSMNPVQKFEPLASIIAKDEHKEITEPSVVDDDLPPSAKKTATTVVEDIPKGPTFTPLSQLKDDTNIGDENKEVNTTPEDKSDKKKEEESSVVGSDEDDAESPGVDVNDVFTFFTENNLLNVPKDFKFDGKQETFDKVLEYDQKVREMQAINRIEESIQDPRVFKLIEHGIAGGKFADIAAMFEVTKAAVNLDTLDISKPSDAETILRKYYREVGKFSDEKTNRFVTVAKEQDSLKDEAKEALDHYKEFYAGEQERLNKEAIARKTEAATEFKQLVTGVSDAIKELGYQGDVVKGIGNLMQPVVDANNGNQQVYKEDGKPMLWYEVVVEQVSENPKHLAEFLSLLQGYDTKEGFNKVVKRVEKTQESEKAKGAFEMFNKISKNKAGSAAGSTGSGKPYVPPAPDSYDI